MVGGQYIAYTWCQRVSTSDHTDVTNDGAVTVIDGGICEHHVCKCLYYIIPL